MYVMNSAPATPPYSTVDTRGGNLLAPHDSIPIQRSTIRF